MATRNRILALLEKGEATLEDAVEAIAAFEHEVVSGHGVETRTCTSCGRPFVVSADAPVVDEQGRRSVCWRPACRQELRARGLRLTGHHLHAPNPFRLRH
jgi:hypothetical protein